MPKFLCLQRSISNAPAGEPPSPAQMQAMYEAFNAWREKFHANLVDPGGRLGAGKVVTAQPSDAALVEVKELVGGYMIVEAGDIEEATRIAAACPGLVRPGSGVEIIEIRSP